LQYHVDFAHTRYVRRASGLSAAGLLLSNLKGSIEISQCLARSAGI
jgi:hypothetical protein